MKKPPDEGGKSVTYQGGEEHNCDYNRNLLASSASRKHVNHVAHGDDAYALHTQACLDKKRDQ